MPIYEYDCPQCGTFEVTQRISEPSLAVHGPCGAPVARKISRTTFALKGGGWYADGYGSKGASGSSGKDSGGSSSSSSSP